MLLEFEQGNLDYVDFTSEIANRLLADRNLRPQYSSRGIKHYRIPRAYTSYLYFNMEDPIVGGFGSEHLALRRAIALGFDTDALGRVAYGGQALPINQLIAPGVAGHDPSVPARSLYEPSAAEGLLERFGYAKRDPQGYRLNVRFKSGWRVGVPPIKDGKRGAETLGVGPTSSAKK